MKLGLALLGVLLLIATSVSASQDVIFKAMNDELKRNSDELVMENLERPFYIAYTIDDYQQLNVTGSLGTLLRSDVNRGRYLTVDLRVGNHEIDNSGFVSGWSEYGPHYDRVSVDNDYDALRNQIYLSTDQAYKDALKTLSKKRAYLQSRVVKNRPADFLELKPNRFLDEPEPFDIEQQAVEDLVIAATEVFRDYPMIVSSELAVEGGVINQYLVNTIGSQCLRGDRLYKIELALAGKNDEGEDIDLADRVILDGDEQLPSAAELTAWTLEQAEKMKALVAGDTVEEYIGPVILTEDAAGEFFRQLFAANISNVPPTSYEDERFGSMFPAAEFANKINRRVLPAFFDVFDDPTLKEYKGLELVGHYEVDDVGVPPQRIQLVEKGKLRTLPLATAPTKKVKEPNGHARGAVSKDVTAKPSNLIFESGDQVSYDQLKRSLLELCQDIDLEYGLIIKSIRDLNAPGPGQIRFYGMPSSGTGGLTQPLEVYKVYTDGREIPVRGLEFANVTVRVLKDILQTDDQMYLYNYLAGADYEMPISVVCPSVLIEEIELKQSEEKTQKPPVLPSPLAEL
jgi:predicted Zn-dependent protease